ncbi:vascular endothelial zinc finger 1b isoform 2-T2 [Polymixia lowei]
MEPSWSTFLFQQANEALHHQHQVAGNSLLPLLNSGTEPPDQKPVLPIPLDQKPPVSAAELLKDNVASGTGGGGGSGPVAVVKKEPKSKTPFICGYCNKAFRDSYHLRRHESCHTGIKMVSRPKKTQTAPTMVPLISTVPRENSGNPSYISTVAGILTTATTSTSTGTSIMTPMQHQQQQSIPKKPPKPVKKNHGCDMCGKAFRDVYHLNRHKLSHSDEKPFECPICQQRFKRKDRMTYHVRSHDGGVHKPYICSVCGKGFSRENGTGKGECRCRGQTSPEEMGLQWQPCSQWPDHLSCHVKHVHSSERPFKCQVTACTSAFATKDRLRSHMIRHEGKVTCNICGKMLSAAYITSHLKTHGQASFNSQCNNKGISDWQWNHSGPRKDANNVHNSASATPVTNSAAITSTVNRAGNTSNPVTIAAQMNITTSTVNITSPVNLQHPVTITGPVNLASVNIPTTAHMNIAHPVAITTPMPMNITGPLNIAMRPMESMPFLSQVLPSSPPW